MKENNEKKVKNSKENSKLIKAFPKHIAALDKRSVLAILRLKNFKPKHLLETLER